MQEDWLLIGKIVSTQGIKGEMRVLSYSDFPERFEDAGTRWLSPTETPNPKNSPQPIQLLRGRVLAGKQNLYVVKLAGIDTYEQAEALRNHWLFVPASDRIELDQDEYHFGDLIGCTVVHQETAVTLGTVISILTAGNDLLEIQPPDPKLQPFLLPFVAALVPSVDLERQIITALPPKGLIP
jgi:16S rRNA processing protein RimM